MNPTILSRDKSAFRQSRESRVNYDANTSRRVMRDVSSIDKGLRAFSILVIKNGVSTWFQARSEYRAVITERSMPKVVPNVPECVLKSISLEQGGDVSTALNILYKGLDVFLKASAWPTLNQLFLKLNPSVVPINTSLAILISTKRCKDKLSKRGAYLRGLRRHLEEKPGEDVNGILYGLD